MTLYRYRIEPRSAFATPMRSDTLYGHLLWAAAELHGAGKVEELLTAFRSPEPPFRLSSAFPQGFLPMPVLPPLPRDEVAGGDRAAKVQVLSQWKRFRRLAWLPLELWCRLRHHLSLRRLWEAFRQEPEQFEVPESFTWHQPHVALDRRTGSVRDEGGLFYTTVQFTSRWDLYLKSDDPELFEELLDHVATLGFGADRTLGRGHFTWERDPDFDPSQIQGDGKHLLNLSVCATPHTARVKGWYRPLVKLGKAWCGFGQISPFKRPFLAFAEGSVFWELPRDGFVLEDIHPDPRVVQVTWPLCLPFRWGDRS
jgi:CRISPR-associated protein Csm4